MASTKLVVVNENTLGYIEPEFPKILNILRAMVTKGATFRIFDEPIPIMESDVIRLASEKDFEEYRVSFDGYKNCNLIDYEYEKN